MVHLKKVIKTFESFEIVNPFVKLQDQLKRTAFSVIIACLNVACIYKIKKVLNAIRH